MSVDSDLPFVRTGQLIADGEYRAVLRDIRTRHDGYLALLWAIRGGAGERTMRSYERAMARRRAGAKRRETTKATP